MHVGLKHIEPKITYTAKFFCLKVVGSNVHMPDMGNSYASLENCSFIIQRSRATHRGSAFTQEPSYSRVEKMALQKGKKKLPWMGFFFLMDYGDISCRVIKTACGY